MKHSIKDACSGNQRMYFFDDNIQALCEFSVIDEDFKVLAVYIGNEFISSNIFLLKDCIYITSFQTTDFLKYDIKLGTLIKIVSNDIDSNLEWPNIYDHHMISNNRLWSFPNYQGKPIYYYDFESGFSIDKKLCNIYVLECNDESVSRFSTNFNNTYWKAFYKTNKYLKYDLQSQTVKLYVISDSEIQINSISFDGEFLWATLANSATIIKCTQEGEILNIFEDIEGLGEEIFSRLYCIEQYIIGVPRFGDFILFIDKNLNDTKRVYLREINPELDIKMDGCSKILKCLKYGNKLFFWGFGIDALILTDIDGNSARYIPIKFTKDDLEKITRIKMIKNSIIFENGTRSFPNFLLGIVENSNRIEKHYEIDRGSSGNKIYEVIGKENS
ncbi:MAG: hypothetical protein HFG41_13530 [Coprococcus sp.]|nr:hypothetical protein [Coprococcus sp.]